MPEFEGRRGYFLQTLFVCPSQWDGQLDDGTYVYVRYRWGYLSVGLDKTPIEAVGNTVWGRQCSHDPYHGSMTTEEMADFTGFKIDGELAEPFRIDWNSLEKEEPEDSEPDYGSGMFLFTPNES